MKFNKRPEHLYVYSSHVIIGKSANELCKLQQRQDICEDSQSDSRQVNLSQYIYIFVMSYNCMCVSKNVFKSVFVLCYVSSKYYHNLFSNKLKLILMY